MSQSGWAYQSIQRPKTHFKGSHFNCWFVSVSLLYRPRIRRVKIAFFFFFIEMYVDRNTDERVQEHYLMGTCR